jgi:hypothetical protein
VRKLGIEANGFGTRLDGQLEVVVGKKVENPPAKMSEGIRRINLDGFVEQISGFYVFSLRGRRNPLGNKIGDILVGVRLT